MNIKEWILVILKGKLNIVQLRIEVEAPLQSKTVSEAERRRTDFWLTDSFHLSRWLPSVGRTLEHLCIVDYGQQAIMRRSKIVKLLSENCPHLKTLDLRNLFIDTSDCEIMPSMVNLTLRCVKVVSETLNHINIAMPNLQTLALLGVFGAEGGIFTLQHLKVLCLGLSTPATDVVMDCPKLEKLQLKMQSPHKLIIRAGNLKYVAFNMDVMEYCKVEMISMVGLRELLYGATSFVTLTSLIDKNMKNLEKIFLDIPCMALAEDGRFLGVLKDTTMVLPSFTKLHQCEKLDVLNIGPGLWYSMETQVPLLQAESKWPSMKNLILHMIPHDMGAAITVLRMLLRLSVRSLVIFIHESSPMTMDLMTPEIEGVVHDCKQDYDQDIEFVIHKWNKHLDFSCFCF
jgi:hypothetical protein